MIENKICPIMCHANQLGEVNCALCLEGLCAWWVEPVMGSGGRINQQGHCSIRDLGSIRVLAAEASRL